MWIDTNKELPDCKRHVLMMVERDGSSYITQGYLTDRSIDLRSSISPERWRELGYGLTWFDYANRQIQSLLAKKSKNNVTRWMPLEGMKMKKNFEKI